MHKYIKKAARQQAKLLKGSNQGQKFSKIFVSDIRKLYETGRRLSERTTQDLLINSNLSQKQQIIYELLMSEQIRMIENIMKSNKLSKKQVIDSNKQLRILYEITLKQSNIEKKVDQSKNKQQIVDLRDKFGTIQMSKRQLFMDSLMKRFRIIKKINPTYVGIILTVVFILLLLRKFKAKIVPVLKTLLNV